MAKLDDLPLNIIWLASLWNFSHAWQINQGQVDNSSGEYFAKNRLRTYLFIVATFTLCVNLDLISGLLQVKVFLSGPVREFNPILRGRWRVRQLNYRWASRHNICASWQEITPADTLEHTGFTA